MPMIAHTQALLPRIGIAAAWYVACFDRLWALQFLVACCVDAPRVCNQGRLLQVSRWQIKSIWRLCASLGTKPMAGALPVPTTAYMQRACHETRLRSIFCQKSRSHEFRQFARNGTFQAIHVPGAGPYWRVVTKHLPALLAPGDMFRVSCRVEPDGPPERARYIQVSYLGSSESWSCLCESILACHQNAEAVMPLPAATAGPSRWHVRTNLWHPERLDALAPSAPPQDLREPRLLQLPSSRPPPPPPPPPMLEKQSTEKPTPRNINVQGTFLATALAPADALVVVAASPAIGAADSSSEDIPRLLDECQAWGTIQDLIKERETRKPPRVLLQWEYNVFTRRGIHPPKPPRHPSPRAIANKTEVPAKAPLPAWPRPGPFDGLLHQQSPPQSTWMEFLG